MLLSVSRTTTTTMITKIKEEEQDELNKMKKGRKNCSKELSKTTLLASSRVAKNGPRPRFKRRRRWHLQAVEGKGGNDSGWTAISNNIGDRIATGTKSTLLPSLDGGQRSSSLSNCARPTISIIKLRVDHKKIISQEAVKAFTIISATFLFIVIISAQCDPAANLHSNLQASGHLYLQRHRRPHAAAAAEAVAQDANGTTNCGQPAPAIRRRHSQTELSTRSELATGAAEEATGGQQQSNDDARKVAALASKLEHWLVCRRLAAGELLLAAAAEAAAATPSPSSASSGLATAAVAAAGLASLSDPEAASGRHQQQHPPQFANASAAYCAAHYDGHLCWPPARVGERIKLPCPKLGWLPNQKQQQQKEHSELKSVIEASRSMATASIAQNVPGTTLESSQTPATDNPIERNDNFSEVRFAYRNCEPIGSGNGDSGQQQQADGNNLMLVQLTNSATARLAQTAGLSAKAGKDTVGAQGDSKGQWQAKANYSECFGQTKQAATTRRGPEVSSDGSSEAEAEATPKATLPLDSSSSGDESDDPFDPTDKWIKLKQEPDRRLFATLVEELDRIEGAIDPYSDPDLQEQWSLCIGNIMRHQRRARQHHQTLERPGSESQLQSQLQPGANGQSDLWCPIIFDGWRCWPSTRAGDTAYVSCPSNQPGFSTEREAHKICTPDGSWYRHPMTNRYWSNYTTCVDTADLAFRTKILNLYVIGNFISLVALSASLIIFISFKSLKCTRVTIHKNLFLSFITNNLMWIIWYTCVVNDADILQSNPIECQLWHILLHYFLVTNYSWMFCEGLYLHTLLVVAFVSEDKILKWFYLLGWLTPVPITVAYAYNRSYDEYYTNFCWMEESPHNLILMAPIGISLLLNLVFLVNIVRVLVTKLRANNSPDAHQTRKAVRATLILIPLLGLHYILTPFRPEAKSEWEGIYETVAAVCTSFQGLCVAILFCFCNGEVIKVIKKKLKNTFNSAGRGGPHEQVRSRSNTGTVASYLSATSNNHLSNLNNDNNHNGSNNNGSHTLRSVISSRNGDLIAQQSHDINIEINDKNNQNVNHNNQQQQPLLHRPSLGNVAIGPVG